MALKNRCSSLFSMTVGSDPNSDNRRLSVLDGLRGLAAYIVVVSHATNATGLAGGLLGRGAGQIGVMLFFVLSGFLMGHLYLGLPATGDNVRRFAFRRFARVVPLYYIVVTVAVTLTGISRWIGRDFTIYPIEPGDLIYHYGLVQGVGGFWTVPVEIHFYIVFVGIWWLYNRSRIVALSGTLVVILWYFLDRTDARQEFPLLDYIAYFLGGLVISLGIGKVKAGFSWTIAFICSGISCFLLFPIVFAKSFGQVKWVDGTQMWHDPLCFIAVCALLGTSVLAPAARFVLANRFMIYSGRISYSIYLLHAPIIMFLIRFTSAGQYPVVLLALAFAISIILASLSYRWLENPLRAAFGNAGPSGGATDPGRQAIAS